jgi:hypothetical protein
MPLQATSGAASQDAFGGNGVAVVPTYIEDVFSTWLYTGNNGTQTITNGIDLSTKGGLVWGKSRNTGSTDQQFFDTVRGKRSILFSNLTNAAYITTTDQITYNTDGFTWNGSGDDAINASGLTYASWTFRKQPKFFDVVTWTGTGGSRTITTALNGTTGCIILKRTDTADQWWVVHRSGANGFDSYGILNQTAAFTATGSGVSSVTDTSFTVTSYYNGSGSTWVAYIFAHNAGGFGLTGTDNVISCGGYTGNGTAGNAVTLGYEPQWVIIKRTDTAGNNWFVQDVMRGIPNAGSSFYLYPNTSDAETDGGAPTVIPTATGFTLPSYGSWNANGGTFIYIAIRRGPMKVPTTGTSVFTPATHTGTGTAISLTAAGFPPDLFWSANRDTIRNRSSHDRLRGIGLLLLNSTAAEDTGYTNSLTSFNMTGISVGTDSSAQTINNSAKTYAHYYFRRAPSFMDVVCYTGTGSARTVSHNLAAVPELIIIKNRGSSNWAVNVRSINTNNWILNLEEDTARFNNALFSSAPTSSEMTFTGAQVNAASNTYVAYLFSTCAGVSKVFSYTGNGSSQTINCGFTGGARFVLIKRTDSAGDWYVWDTARGIVSGNDPHLSLNTTAAEVTTDDTIDTDSTGFVVNQVSATNVNVSSATYIGLAIA